MAVALEPHNDGEERHDQGKPNHEHADRSDAQWCTVFAGGKVPGVFEDLAEGGGFLSRITRWVALRPVSTFVAGAVEGKRHPKETQDDCENDEHE